jgi:hypothetical protein
MHFRVIFHSPHSTPENTENAGFIGSQLAVGCREIPMPLPVMATSSLRCSFCKNPGCPARRAHPAYTTLMSRQRPIFIINRHHPRHRRRSAMLLGWLTAIWFAAIQHSLLAATVDGNDQVTSVVATSDMEAAVANALHGCAPKSQIQAGINKNNVYVLSGNLFGTGDTYAVIDHDPILLAKWGRGQWKLRMGIGVTPAWMHPGWETASPGREPEADRPFWIEKLKREPLLIVASYVEKAGQHYDSILFNSDISSVSDSDDSIPQKPEVLDDVLVSTDCSRNKADEADTYFSKIENGKFVVLASWQVCVPWYAEHDSEGLEFTIANAGKQSYLIEDCGELPDQPFWGYVVFKGAFDPGSWADINAEKSKRPYATVFFSHRSKHDSQNSDQSAGDIEYIFEKLLHLPRTLCPSGYFGPSSGPHPRIESAASLKVTGNPELMRLLLPTLKNAHDFHENPY